MKITIDIPDTLADAIATKVAAILAANPPTTVNVSATPTVAPSKQVAAAPAPVAVPTPAPAPAAVPTPAPAPVAPAAPPVADKEAMKKLLMQLREKQGLPAAKAFLQEVGGVANPNLVPDDKIAAVSEGCRKLLAQEV